MTLANGLHEGVAMADYLSIQAFSGGMAQRILSASPLHAWTESPWNPKRDRDDSNAADIGTYAHAMLLENGLSCLCVVDAEDWRTKAVREARDAAREAGRLPILAGKVAEVEQMVHEARRFIAASELSGLFDDGAPEQTVIWEEDGLPCKARPDWLSGRVCLSYKTTPGSAAPDAWIRTQLPGYDCGMILYERGLKACGKDVSVIHLVQEQKPPYSCSLIGLAPAWHDMAEARLNIALRTWRACLASGKFPAYPYAICYAEPSSWMMAQTEEQELTHE